MNRRLALWLVAPAAVVALSSCSATPVALKVGNEEYSKDFVERDLAAMAVAQIAARDSEAAKADISSKIYGGTDKSRYTADYTQFVLNGRMVQAVVHLEFEASGLKRRKLTGARLDEVFQQAGGETAFRKMSPDLQALAMRSAEEMAAMITAEQAKLGTAEQFFEKHRNEFPSSVCSAHILVATLEAAQAVRARLVAGEDFGAVAKSASLDPGSREADGDLGCGDPAQFVPEFAAAVRELPIGQISQPVQSQFGFHVIVVKSRTTPSFASSRVAVEQAMAKEAQKQIDTRLIARLQRTPVSVDPSLGKVLRDGPSGYTQIMPPGFEVTASAGAPANG